MRYISTRGGIEPLGFTGAVMMGLATDGGLLLPEEIPTVSPAVADSWARLSYQELAAEVMGLFAGDLPPADLKALVTTSYATFRHPEVTPVREVGGIHILELFHGPTLAFKDVALQFLGNLFARELARTGSFMNILGATSGDTGSAAIHGVRGKERINIFILHPHGKVSPIQELQMTSVLDANVHNIAIRGTFDDGQAIVKALFNDLPFKERYRLGAINSINWARILAQVVYYIYSCLRVGAGGPVEFAVPTGNFGDIFAGYVARRLLGSGRIRRLVLATNDNDILSRFVRHGDYSTREVRPTISPSMDIQLASNFERYLYYLNGEDPARTAADMERFAADGSLRFDEEVLARVRGDFAALKVGEDEVVATIGEFHRRTGYVLDPHTAVAVRAGRTLATDVPMICLATAHPGKFADAVRRAVGEFSLPAPLADLEGNETRCMVMDATVEAVRAFVEEKALTRA